MMIYQTDKNVKTSHTRSKLVFFFQVNNIETNGDATNCERTRAPSVSSFSTFSIYTKKRCQKWLKKGQKDENITT